MSQQAGKSFGSLRIFIPFFFHPFFDKASDGALQRASTIHRLEADSRGGVYLGDRRLAVWQFLFFSRGHKAAECTRHPAALSCFYFAAS
jgi:hypothetical protein